MIAWFSFKIYEEYTSGTLSNLVRFNYLVCAIRKSVADMSTQIVLITTFHMFLFVSTTRSAVASASCFCCYPFAVASALVPVAVVLMVTDEE